MNTILPGNYGTTALDVVWLHCTSIHGQAEDQTGYVGIFRIPSQRRGTVNTFSPIIASDLDLGRLDEIRCRHHENAPIIIAASRDELLTAIRHRRRGLHASWRPAP